VRWFCAPGIKTTLGMDREKKPAVSNSLNNLLLAMYLSFTSPSLSSTPHRFLSEGGYVGARI
jgi:hypothetical protein